MPTPPKAPKASLSVTIRKDLADWLEEASEERIIGKAVLVEKGLELVKDLLAKTDKAYADTATPHALATDPGRPTSSGS